MINVGIIGFGIVGSGTAKLLLENKDILSERLGFELKLKRIADLDIVRDRGIKVPEGVLTTDVNHIFDDPDIQIVVELMGGINPAKNFILKAIRRANMLLPPIKLFSPPKVPTYSMPLLRQGSRSDMRHP